ncbi:hypothetical protein [Halobacterium wangiae]|uniref:hypothetical protein n=1 Tax=Halobacterium wangiae TaxID=2902623 RepID=UPI001E601BD3|nr:hypothetical protein [Halobacterium wangiae]
MAGRKPTIDDEDILYRVVISSGPVVSTTEIVRAFNLTYQGMHSRLQSMAEEGLLDTKKIGRARAWWITDAGKNKLLETYTPTK